MRSAGMLAKSERTQQWHSFGIKRAHEDREGLRLQGPCETQLASAP